MAKPETFSNPVRGTSKPASIAGFIIKNHFRTQIRTIIKENSSQRMAADLPYKTAKLSSGDPEDWFVYYYYRDPQTLKFKRYKERHGLNNFRQLDLLSAQYRKPVDDCRRIMADEMIKVIDESLKKGFNPIKQEVVLHSLANDTLLDTVNKVVEDLCKAATQNAKETYRLMFSRFKKYVTARGMEEWPPATFDVEHAEDFQEYLQMEMKLAKKTVNASISHLGMFWDELKKKVKHNPFRQVKALKDKDYAGIQQEDDEDIFEPLTSAELDKILKKLKEQKQQGFITFLAFIYYAWMRPVEITRLKVSNIDMDAGVIRTSKADTKNKKGGMVQIVPPLMDLLKKMKLEKVRMDHYLFSKGFKPGPTQVDASRGVGFYHWNPVVKDLGINKKMYALKHSGNIEYLMKNKGHADLKWQQMQNRHSSAAMTEKYNRKLGAYFIDVGKVKFRSF